MKIVPVFILSLLFVSCKPKDKKISSAGMQTADSTEKKEPAIFFPVTNYIKGQVVDIKTGGVNPLKMVTIRDRIDSSWIKMEDINKEIADFLSPEIDSVNLVSLFSETKFFDRTLDAITFTYDPIKTLPDSFSLRHWDVYVDPNTSRVRQVYILKKLPGGKTQQLTWISGKNCNTKTIADDMNGKSSVVKETTLKWDF